MIVSLLSRLLSQEERRVGQHAPLFAESHSSECAAVTASMVHCHILQVLSTASGTPGSNRLDENSQMCYQQLEVCRRWECRDWQVSLSHSTVFSCRNIYFKANLCFFFMCFFLFPIMAKISQGHLRAYIGHRSREKMSVKGTISRQSTKNFIILSKSYS